LNPTGIKFGFKQSSDQTIVCATRPSVPTARYISSVVAVMHCHSARKFRGKAHSSCMLNLVCFCTMNQINPRKEQYMHIFPMSAISK